MLLGIYQFIFFHKIYKNQKYILKNWTRKRKKEKKTENEKNGKKATDVCKIHIIDCIYLFMETLISSYHYGHDVFIDNQVSINPNLMIAV